MSTIEAIQVKLEGRRGIILWPGTPEDPPGYINDEDIARENPPFFKCYNPHGPVFVYERHEPQMRWYLQRKFKPRKGL